MSAINEGVAIAEDGNNARAGLLRMVAESVGKDTVTEVEAIAHLNNVEFPADLTFVVKNAADVDQMLASFTFAQ
jgi:hypothetical protein